MKFWEFKVSQIPGPLSHPSPQLICGMTIFWRIAIPALSLDASVALLVERRREVQDQARTQSLLQENYFLEHTDAAVSTSGLDGAGQCTDPSDAHAGLAAILHSFSSVSCLPTVKLEPLKAGARRPWYGHRESLTAFTIPSTHLHFPQKSVCTVSPES